MSCNLAAFRKFLHWGPITTLIIIKCITLTSVYMNSMWWPPNGSFAGFIHQALFLFFSSLATYNYVMATLVGPGILEKKWHPTNPKDVEFLQYCKICEGYKAPRSHHCRKCNRCIKKMDHHCPWINHCVGWANHAYFIQFLLFAIIGSLHGSIILCCSFYRGIYRYWYLIHGYQHLATVHFTSVYSILACVPAMGLAIGVVIELSVLLYLQMRSVVKNQTGIEMWIVEKAYYRRLHYQKSDIEEFIYPYDLGWLNNVKQVFCREYVEEGAGIIWPVVDNCDQYTLTREQIAQKWEKRCRTRTYKCIRPATGSYLPLFSQGLRVCLAYPCTDEARIVLQPDDIIKVTRFRNHWLFGERVVDNECGSELDRKGAVRGWFPRRCAIEVISPNIFCQQQMMSDENQQIINNRTKTLNNSGDNEYKLNHRQQQQQQQRNGLHSKKNE